MKILKRIINILIAFVLTLLILADFITILAKNTLLNENYIIEKLAENEYYEKVKIDLDNEFENYLYQSGLPEEVFDNLYLEENLKSDINSVIDGLYKGTEIEINTDYIEEQLISNINQYLEKENRVLNEEEQNNVDIFRTIISDSYKNKINFLANYVDNVYNIINKISTYLDKAIIIFATMTIFLLLFGILLNLKTIYEFLNFIAISIFSAGVLIKFVSIAIIKNIDIENLLLINQSFSDFCKFIINDILKDFNMFSIIGIVLGIVEIIYYSVKMSNKNLDPN